MIQPRTERAAAWLAALLVGICLANVRAAVVRAQEQTSVPSSEAQGPDSSDVQLYARVIVDSTVMRSGPGYTFRRVHVAHRGDVFPVIERANRGYWFRVQLPDATYGWVMGEAVYNHEVSDEEASAGRFLPWLFAPPPLMQATGEIAVVFGVLGSGGPSGAYGGFFAARPSFLLSPTFGLELTASASVSAGGRLLFGGAGGIVNVFPESPIVPFVVVGGGGVVSDPNADTFLLSSGTKLMAYGGGGLRIGFRYRLTLRIEARAYAIYDQNRYIAQEEYSGGVTVFF